MPELRHRASAGGAGLGTAGQNRVPRLTEGQKGPKKPTAAAAEQARRIAVEVVGHRQWNRVDEAEHLAGQRGRSALTDLALGDMPLWQEKALCSQTDPEAFFPEKGGSTRHAKRICSRCEVRADCLEYALGHDERFGVWGGLSEGERRKLVRRAA